jgi:hypothetical protein
VVQKLTSILWVSLWESATSDMACIWCSLYVYCFFQNKSENQPPQIQAKSDAADMCIDSYQINSDFSLHWNFALFGVFVSAQLILVLILTPSIQVSGFVNSIIFVVLICMDVFKESITVSVWSEIFLYLVWGSKWDFCALVAWALGPTHGKSNHSNFLILPPIFLCLIKLLLKTSPGTGWHMFTFRMAAQTFPMHSVLEL